MPSILDKGDPEDPFYVPRKKNEPAPVPPEDHETSLFDDPEEDYYGDPD